MNVSAVQKSDIYEGYAYFEERLLASVLPTKQMFSGQEFDDVAPHEGNHDEGLGSNHFWTLCQSVLQGQVFFMERSFSPSF